MSQMIRIITFMFLVLNIHNAMAVEAKGQLEEATVLATGETVVSGWACVVGKSESVQVNLIAYGTGKDVIFFDKVRANLSNEERVNAECGTKGSKHRFQIVLSSEAAKKAQGMTFRVFAFSKDVDYVAIPGDKKNEYKGQESAGIHNLWERLYAKF